jgi:sugar lactone lactonase YvrE
MRRSLASAGRMILPALIMVAIAIGSAQAGSIAARVLGQPDFAHKSANGVDAQSLTINNSHGGVAVDSAGHLYVTDLNNNRVLGWHSVAALVNDEPADLVIGQPDFFTGAAPTNASASNLSNPQGVAVDSAGNVYVADTSHSRVLIFPNPFTTMSQTGQTAGFTATAALGQVGDFTSGACNIGVSGAASPDTLCLPDDVAVDASNNVYVADSANNRVVEYGAPVNGATIGANRVFGQLGSFITNSANAGGSVSKDTLKLPSGVAVDKNNNLYVVDFGNNRVLEYNTPRTTTIVTGSGDSSADEVWGQGNNFTNSTCNNGGVTASSLCFPIKVALDGSGNLYVSDTSSNRVLEYDEGANPPTNLTASRAFGQSNFTSSSCNKGAATPTSATLCPATGLALDSSGDLFALDGNNNRVLEYKTPLTTDTTADIVLGEPDFVHTFDIVNPSSLSAPKQVAIDPSSGAIAVADNGNNRVLGWGHAASFVNGAPADLVIGQADFFSGQLNRTGSSPAANTLWSPSGVAFDSAGNLYIGDTLNSRVVEYNTPLAACAGVFPCVGGSANLIIGQSSATVSSCNGGSNPSSTTLCQPTQVNVDSLGNLYVADFGNNRVLEYNTPLTVVSAVAGSGDTTADLVFGQGATGTGTDFTTSDCNQSLSALTAFSMCDPQGVSVDPTGNVYISDTKNDRILEFNETVNATTAPVNVTANAVFGQNGSFTNNLLLATGADALDMPFGLSFDGTGNLYAADEVNNRVLEFFTPLTSTAILGSGDTIADVLWGQGGNMVSSGCNVGGPVPSAATLCGPFSVAVDSADNVYISDTSNNRITAYSLPFTPPGADVQSDSSGVLEIKPASIRFAATRVGKRRFRQVTLTNRGPVPVQIENLNALGDFTYLNGCPSQLLPGSSCEIRVTFAPVAAGQRGGVVAIGDDARFSPHRIELSGHAKKRRGAR